MSETKHFGSLTGRLSGSNAFDPYYGSYMIVPQASGKQTLETAGKLLGADIVVAEIPYVEINNDANGETAYIAKEIT